MTLLLLFRHHAVVQVESPQGGGSRDVQIPLIFTRRPQQISKRVVETTEGLLFSDTVTVESGVLHSKTKLTEKGKTQSKFLQADMMRLRSRTIILDSNQIYSQLMFTDSIHVESKSSSSVGKFLKLMRLINTADSI